MKSRKNDIFFCIAGDHCYRLLFLESHQWYESHIQRLPVLGPEKHTVGNFSFKNQSGADISQDEWKGKISCRQLFFHQLSFCMSESHVCIEKVQATRIEKCIDQFLYR